MSELEQEELQEEQVEDVPDELVTGPIVDPNVETDAPDDVSNDDEDEEQEQGAEASAEPGVNEARYLTEKQLEKRAESVFKENERHRKRISDLMEEDAVDLIPCPVCMDYFHGWIYDPAKAPLGEEQTQRVLQFVGISDNEQIPVAPWAQMCPDCNGYGEVKTGSKVQHAQTTGCVRCNKQGWLNHSHARETNGHSADVELDLTTGPTVYGAEPDPRIADLRAAGYTVIPPTPIQVAS